MKYFANFKYYIFNTMSSNQTNNQSQVKESKEIFFNYCVFKIDHAILENKNSANLTWIESKEFDTLGREVDQVLLSLKPYYREKNIFITFGGANREENGCTINISHQCKIQEVKDLTAEEIFFNYCVFKIDHAILENRKSANLSWVESKEYATLGNSELNQAFSLLKPHYRSKNVFITFGGANREENGCTINICK